MVEIIHPLALFFKDYPKIESKKKAPLVPPSWLVRDHRGDVFFFPTFIVLHESAISDLILALLYT